MAAKLSPTDAKRARDAAVHEAEMKRLDAEIAYARAQIDAGDLPDSGADELDSALRKSDLRHRKDVLKALNTAVDALVVEQPAPPSEPLPEAESEVLDEPEEHAPDGQSGGFSDRQVDMFDARTA